MVAAPTCFIPLLLSIWPHMGEVGCGLTALQEWQQQMNSSLPGCQLSTSAVWQLHARRPTALSAAPVQRRAARSCVSSLQLSSSCLQALFYFLCSRPPTCLSSPISFIFSPLFNFISSLRLCPLNPFPLPPCFITPLRSLPRSLHPSIHPPYCLTGRVCCFYPGDIGSLPRARPQVEPDASPGSCPLSPACRL